MTRCFPRTRGARPQHTGFLLAALMGLFLGLSLGVEPAQAQLSYAFWIRNVNWDGYTSWQN
ncbi:MAG: hypothetical protein ACKODJ_00790, partial [Bacteroidota bacterium]